jgi:hypothetical protein
MRLSKGGLVVATSALPGHAYTLDLTDAGVKVNDAFMMYFGMHIGPLAYLVLEYTFRVRSAFCYFK